MNVLILGNCMIVYCSIEPVVITDILNVNISSLSVGDNITFECQVKTCLTNVTVYFYKDDQVIETITNINNTMRSMIYNYTLTVRLDSAGEYSCRVVTSKGESEKVFNITCKFNALLLVMSFMCF